MLCSWAMIPEESHNLLAKTMVQASNLLLWGVVAHLLADWLLQNEWMARHKRDLRHPAAWVHSAIHLFCMLFVFSWPAALVIGISHLLIDTRLPVRWWIERVKRMPAKPQSAALEVALDQVFHLLLLAAVALVVA